MDCERVGQLINGYVDGELDLVTALDIEAHLRTCADCARELEALQKLHAAASDKALYHAAPAGLEKRIRASLRQAERAATPSLRSFFSWRWIATAAVVAILLFAVASIIGRGVRVTNQEALVAQEVQVAHVRSLEPNHLMDVVSTDQHTVKPWFDGRLDFSPPVSDLSAQGFPLVGGRLDYLNGRQVAALVYQRNKHYINLFVWPTQEPDASLKSSTYQGYNLYHWNQGGMTFWAVSDLEKQQLLQFIEEYQKSVG